MRRSIGLHTATLITLSALLPGACTNPGPSPVVQASEAPTASASPSPSSTPRHTGGARLLPAFDPVADASPSETPGTLEGAPSEPPLSAPIPTGDYVTDFINQINYRRQGAGFAPLARNQVIDVAAQRHAQYVEANAPNFAIGWLPWPVIQEGSGAPFYSGDWVDERLKAAGYAFDARRSYRVGETVGFPSSLPGIEAAEDALWAVDYRTVLMDPSYREVGAGSATGAGKRLIVADCVGEHQGFWTHYPGDGQRDIPTSPVDWTPDPMGYPITVSGNYALHRIDFGSFTIQPRGGSPLEVQLTGDESFIPPYVAIIPRKALLPGTTYDVHFLGSVEFTWSFTTR